MEEQTQLKMIQLSQVETQTVRWLWYPFAWEVFLMSLM